MGRGSPASLQRSLSSLFDSGTLTGLSDRDLIERFSGLAEGAAEAAFEVLISRHGPMVYRVCRNVLSNPADADDAFQATFLVLVKARRAIRKRDSVASWLYGVAARVSARARVDAARRRRNAGRAIRLAAESLDQAGAADDQDQALFGPVVQEEVRRLPEKYRSVILLCYWEGLTHEQAAASLAVRSARSAAGLPAPRDPPAQADPPRTGASAGVLAASALGDEAPHGGVSGFQFPPVLG